MRNARTRDSYPADWYIEDDEPVAQSPDHQRCEFRLQSTLLAWRERTGQSNLMVGCEMACRWDERHPKVGVDPDVYVVEKPPVDPKTGRLRSLRTWRDGHSPPILAIEIVSDRRPQKDYKESPDKHDLLGTFELWVFDPDLEGYTDQQPPVFLQIFQRETNHHLVQVCAGAGPFRSDALDAWVLVKGKELVIANDAEGLDPWPTLEEAERAVMLQERAAKEAALARIAELEALLAKQSSGT